LEYDFDEGILDPFDPARVPVVLLGAAIAGSVLLFAAKPWVRWAVGLGLALCSAWLVFKADFGDRMLAVTMVVAAAWGIAALLVTVPRSVAVYLSRRAGPLERLLGPVDSAESAREWLAAAAEWEGAGILSTRERRHMAERLSAWLESDVAPEELKQEIAAFAPPLRKRLPVIQWLARFRRLHADAQEASGR
jgi:hypothetical protein